MNAVSLLSFGDRYRIGTVVLLKSQLAACMTSFLVGMLLHLEYWMQVKWNTMVCMR